MKMKTPYLLVMRTPSPRLPWGALMQNGIGRSSQPWQGSKLWRVAQATCRPTHQAHRRINMTERRTRHPAQGRWGLKQVDPRGVWGKGGREAASRCHRIAAWRAAAKEGCQGQEGTVGRGRHTPAHQTPARGMKMRRKPTLCR